MNTTTDFSEMTVEDILEMKDTSKTPTTVLTASPPDNVHDCIDRMVEHEVGSIVVTEGDGEIAGIFTERDYMRKIELNDDRAQETPIQAVMTVDVETVTLDKSLRDCLDRMHDLQCRHLPVVDDHGHLSGIISMRDCLQ